MKFTPLNKKYNLTADENQALTRYMVGIMGGMIIILLGVAVISINVVAGIVVLIAGFTLIKYSTDQESKDYERLYPKSNE